MNNKRWTKLHTHYVHAFNGSWSLSAEDELNVRRDPRQLNCRRKASLDCVMHVYIITSVYYISRCLDLVVNWYAFKCSKCNLNNFVSVCCPAFDKRDN